MMKFAAILTMLCAVMASFADAGSGTLAGQTQAVDYVTLARDLGIPGLFFFMWWRTNESKMQADQSRGEMANLLERVMTMAKSMDNDRGIAISALRENSTVLSGLKVILESSGIRVCPHDEEIRMRKENGHD